ncbi:unnamed protein product [Mytilus coruscus]|uniref:Uncharacterized protein n=1 Tax=Mytilus coruscus TaxID=42192 RepID=A0A6J8ACH5_MYTCO|nr:unnamed protein product [Mytilus coruscus]
MRDRSATELKSNKLLKELKTEELPNDSEINEFQCSVHPLLQFADEVEKVAKEIEKKYDVKFKNLFQNKDESYSHNLIRCISKLFHSDKVGDPLYCRTILRENDIGHVLILDFVGNRFYTLFYNACGTFCLKDLLTTYIISSKDRPNCLLISILQLFENEVITAIIQSIGIIYIKITAPYFSLASQNKPALEMTTTYNTLVDELEKIITNPALLLDTEYIMFPGHTTEISNFNMAVLKPLVAYSTVIECLGQMALSILNKCKKFFTNYLPGAGGKYHCPSLKTINESLTCPSNNISLKRMMGQLDRQKTQHKFDDSKCKVDFEKQQDNGMAR